MPEVKVTKERSLAKPETPAPKLFNELFTPIFPVGRFFGLSPFAVMREFTDEMDRVLRGVVPSVESGTWSPMVDIQQSNGNLVVTAELPGLKKEEVKVELTDDALVIKGERKSEHKEEREGFYKSERSYGQFYRSIPLPDGAKADQAKAELNDGVLKVSVPVPETKKTVRQVTVEEGIKTKPIAA
jgi:HSP20 family protein